MLLHFVCLCVCVWMCFHCAAWVISYCPEMMARSLLCLHLLRGKRKSWNVYPLKNLRLYPATLTVGRRLRRESRGDQGFMGKVLWVMGVRGERLLPSLLAGEGPWISLYSNPNERAAPRNWLGDTEGDLLEGDEHLLSHCMLAQLLKFRPLHCGQESKLWWYSFCKN